ncbi:hypothetical protein MP228_009998 [Amoeboaphelidium protococcarum]|nr:hypothetical protein MP228_009998 [Amoeboaphelidium protococcarum]
MSVNVHYNGKSVKVKASPNSVLNQIKLEACQLLKLNDESMFGLKWITISNNKSSSNAVGGGSKKSGGSQLLDLSLSLRYANIPLNSRLDLVQLTAPNTAHGQSSVLSSNAAGNAQSVLVALQLEDARLKSQFLSTCTLLDILLKFEDQQSSASSNQSILYKSHGAKKSIGNLLKLTDQKKDPSYLQPVILVANREFNTLQQLSATTLSSIGVNSGNVLLRCSFKQSEMSLEQAQKFIQIYQSQAEDRKAGINQEVLTTSSQPQSQSAALKSQQQLQQNESLSVDSTGQQIEQKQAISQNVIKDDSVVQSSSQQQDDVKSAAKAVLGEIKVYRISDNQPSATNLNLPDSYYEISAGDLKTIMQQSAAKNSTDQPLLTKALRDKMDMEKERKYPHTVIRFKFQEQQIMVETLFESSVSTIADLYRFMDGCLHSQDLVDKYYLFTAPPMKRLDKSSSNTLYRSGLSPSAVVHVGLVDQSSVKGEQFLSNAVMEKLTDLPVHPSLAEWAQSSSQSADNLKSSSSASIGGQSDGVDRNNDATSQNESSNSKRQQSSQQYQSNRGDSQSKDSDSDRKVPKWFKMPLGPYKK